MPNILPPEDSQNFLDDLAAMARRKRVSGFKFNLSASESKSVSVRMGNLESTEESTTQSVDLSVYFGRKRGSASTNSMDMKDIRETLEHAIDIARGSSENILLLPADPADVTTDLPDLDLFDPNEPGYDFMLESARAVESIALAQHMIVNSNGASSGYRQGHTSLLSSNGFRAQEKYSTNYLSTSVLAGNGIEMEGGFASTSARWGEDLKPADEIGKLAATRAAESLGSKPMKTGILPVVFDPRVSGSLVGAFLNAIGANQVFRKETFLHNSLHKQIFPASVTIIDDPRIQRALAAGAFDEQGIARNRLTIVENGILQSWISSLYGARKLKIKSTGHADGFGTRIMLPGSLSPQELIADIKEGFYVTGLSGTKASPLTGLYSTGAQGFVIRNGILTGEAVNGVTLGGTLSKIFANITPANDVNLGESKRKTSLIPTLRVEGLMLGGT